MVAFEPKERYSVRDLLEIMALLRAPGGCPWDAAQTHESIRKNLIEETYEVIEAINKASPAMLLEELGDLLMQVVFHAQMAKEQGQFDFDDVADGICKKLVERHPHVFGAVHAETEAEALSSWDAVKRKTKGQATTASAMESVPRELPALMRATKIQKKAADAGFDWDDAQGAFDKVGEECAELQQAFAEGDPAAVAEELGDLLFAAVNVSRFVHTDAEEALTAASDKFLARFTAVEQLAAARGIEMKTAGIAALDALWEEVKAAQKQPPEET